VILLARHGQTAYNRELRFQGHLPVPLDATGRAQAAELAVAAAARGDIVALWSSSLARALETARIVGERLGLEPRVDARFAETDAGAWTDRYFADVQAEDPDRFAAFVRGERSFAFPGGESFIEQEQRIAAAVADVRASSELPALVVCHAVTIRLALFHEHGDGAVYSMAIPNGALIEL
jgi:probable phosphoglycerate mutase